MMMMVMMMMMSLWSRKYENKISYPKVGWKAKQKNLKKNQNKIFCPQVGRQTFQAMGRIGGIHLRGNRWLGYFFQIFNIWCQTSFRWGGNRGIEEKLCHFILADEPSSVTLSLMKENVNEGKRFECFRKSTATSSHLFPPLMRSHLIKWEDFLTNVFSCIKVSSFLVPGWPRLTSKCLTTFDLSKTSTCHKIRWYLQKNDCLIPPW